MNSGNTRRSHVDDIAEKSRRLVFGSRNARTRTLQGHIHRGQSSDRDGRGACSVLRSASSSRCASSGSDSALRRFCRCGAAPSAAPWLRPQLSRHARHQVRAYGPRRPLRARPCPAPPAGRGGDDAYPVSGSNPEPSGDAESLTVMANFGDYGVISQAAGIVSFKLFSLMTAVIGS
jgi:hypothetical protein